MLLFPVVKLRHRDLVQRLRQQNRGAVGCTQEDAPNVLTGEVRTSA
jgi:hypothetical protein